MDGRDAFHEYVHSQNGSPRVESGAGPTVAQDLQYCKSCLLLLLSSSQALVKRLEAVEKEADEQKVWLERIKRDYESRHSK